MRFCDVIRKGVEVLVRREKVKKSEIKGYAISFSILSAFGGGFKEGVPCAKSEILVPF